MTKAGLLAADFEAFKKEVEARLSALENPKEEVKKVSKKTSRNLFPFEKEASKENFMKLVSF